MNMPVAGEYHISSDPALLDIPFIHQYLSNESYWAKGISMQLVERSIAHSICFGVYQDSNQVGFARVTSDRATFAYLADVFIDAAHRGRGLSKRLMEAIMQHPDLQQLRRWMLATRDAHELYRQFGFTALPFPERIMQYQALETYVTPVQHPNNK